MQHGPQGGTLGTARYYLAGVMVILQTHLVFGGTLYSPNYGQTEEYNGSCLGEKNDINTGRYISYGGAWSL